MTEREKIALYLLNRYTQQPSPINSLDEMMDVGQRKWLEEADSIISIVRPVDKPLKDFLSAAIDLYHANIGVGSTFCSDQENIENATKELIKTGTNYIHSLQLQFLRDKDYDR